MTFIDDYGQVSLRILAVPRGNPVSFAWDVEYLCELRYPRLRTFVDDIFITSAPLTTSAVPIILVAPFAHSSTDVLFTVILKCTVDSGAGAVVLLAPRSTTVDSLITYTLDNPYSLKTHNFFHFPSWYAEIL